MATAVEASKNRLASLGINIYLPRLQVEDVKVNLLVYKLT